MPEEYDPAHELYNPDESAAALRDAVADLAQATGRSPESFTGMSLAEIAALADATYDQLPQFWKVWQDWHAPQPPPQMGDL